MNRVWVSSWDGALADPERGAGERARDRRPALAAAPAGGRGPAARRASGGDPDDLVATIAAFTHGLVVQALFDPRAFPRKRQTALADAFVADLA